jgi:DNA-binding CsgD family transcriptional regulator
MPGRQLTPREDEIVDLCVEGLTNEQIALQLGLSIGTINTYWLRIKFKAGGLGKTDTVVKVLSERAKRAVRSGDLEQIGLPEVVAQRTEYVRQYRIALSLLQLTLDQLKAVVWAANTELTIQVIMNGKYPINHNGTEWEAGKTVRAMFETEDDSHPAIAVHLRAVEGEEGEVSLDGYFDGMCLRVVPLYDDGDNEVLGCISILNEARN